LPRGSLRQGNNEVLIEFRDRNGQLADVGNVKFDLNMNMPGMQMSSGGTIERTIRPDAIAPRSRSACPAIGMRKFLTKVNRGNGQTNFNLNAKP